MWFLVALAVVALIVVIWRATTRLSQHAVRINDYYALALGAWILREDAAARMAALTAAKVAAPLQRASMVNFLDICRPILVAQGASERKVVEMFAAFSAEVSATDWTTIDAARAKSGLASADPEYARALDIADPKVFKRRYPELA